MAINWAYPQNLSAHIAKVMPTLHVGGRIKFYQPKRGTCGRIVEAEVTKVIRRSNVKNVQVDIKGKAMLVPLAQVIVPETKKPIRRRIVKRANPLKPYRANILRHCNDAATVAKRRQTIYDNIAENFGTDVTKFDSETLEAVVHEYDQLFFHGAIAKRLSQTRQSLQLRFSRSKIDSGYYSATTISGGPGRVTIGVSRTILNSIFLPDGAKTEVSAGIICRDRLMVLLTIIEQQLVHLLLANFATLKQRRRMLRLANDIFCHRDAHHQLGLGLSENPIKLNARIRAQLKVDQMVTVRNLRTKQTMQLRVVKLHKRKDSRCFHALDVTNGQLYNVPFTAVVN